MSKKTIKMISIILTVLMVMIALAPMVFAESLSDQIKPDANAAKDIELGVFKIAGSQIISVIKTVGMVVSVVIIMVLGIKYMMGSAEQKADYKKTMMPFLVGAILLFGASALADMIFEFATGLGQEATPPPAN